jgi:hypothetical protein
VRELRASRPGTKRASLPLSLSDPMTPSASLAERISAEALCLPPMPRSLLLRTILPTRLSPFVKTVAGASRSRAKTWLATATMAGRSAAIGR